MKAIEQEKPQFMRKKSVVVLSVGARNMAVKPRVRNKIIKRRCGQIRARSDAKVGAVVSSVRVSDLSSRSKDIECC